MKREKEIAHGILRKSWKLLIRSVPSYQFFFHTRFRASLFLTFYRSHRLSSSSHTYVNECIFNFICDAVATAEIRGIKESLF